MKTVRIIVLAILVVVLIFVAAKNQLDRSNSETKIEPTPIPNVVQTPQPAQPASSSTELTETELAALEKVDRETKKLLSDKVFQALPIEEKETQARALLVSLAQQGLIVEDSITYDNEWQIFGFSYPNGILGGLMLVSFEPAFN